MEWPSVYRIAIFRVVVGGISGRKRAQEKVVAQNVSKICMHIWSYLVKGMSCNTFLRSDGTIPQWRYWWHNRSTRLWNESWLAELMETMNVVLFVTSNVDLECFNAPPDQAVQKKGQDISCCYKLVVLAVAPFLIVLGITYWINDNDLLQNSSQST